MWGAVRTRAGSLAGHIVWLAICPYTAYTDLMYVVTPYHEALALYIAAIGLATYRLINGLFRLRADPMAVAFADVLDPTILLPFLALTGVLLLRGHPVAPVLAALVLVKTLTLGLALLSMNAFVAASGGAIDPAEPFLWTAIVVVTLAWLVGGAVACRLLRDRGCGRASGAWTVDPSG